MSKDKEIAEVYFSEIQDKTNQVLRKSGPLPFLDDSGIFDPDNPDDLGSPDGFQVINLYDGIASQDDQKLLNDLYCQVLEEEREEAEENEKDKDE